MEQRFTPPIRLCVGNKQNKIEVALRVWKLETNQMQNNISQDMGYIGQMQIEEVWKRYSTTEKNFRNTYISNYGYVAEIPDVEAKNLSHETQIKLESEGGMAWKDFNDEDKRIFHDWLYKNNDEQHLIKYKYCDDVNMRVCLCVKYKYKELHQMVAEKFLEKPEGEGYWVHHIDNNSYNNNVTNLIYVKGNEHQSKHRDLHPMSRK